MFSELNLIAQPNVSFSDSAPIPFASSDDVFYGELLCWQWPYNDMYKLHRIIVNIIQKFIRTMQLFEN